MLDAKNKVNLSYMYYIMGNEIFFIYVQINYLLNYKNKRECFFFCKLSSDISDVKYKYFHVEKEKLVNLAD